MRRSVIVAKVGCEICIPLKRSKENRKQGWNQQQRVSASDPRANRQGNHRHHEIKVFFDAKRPADVEVGNILVIVLEEEEVPPVESLAARHENADVEDSQCDQIRRHGSQGATTNETRDLDVAKLLVLAPKETADQPAG